MGKLTEEQLRQRYTLNSVEHDLATELLALRAAWKIAEPFLPAPVYRRCLAALAASPEPDPAPSQSDEAAWEPIRRAILAEEPSFRLFVKARAEATLAGAAAEKEACAKLIEEHSILFRSDGPNQLRPRMDGDRAGLDYAVAIRARKP